MATEAKTPTVTTLPEFLQLTPEQQAESDRIQAEVRQALHGRVQANQKEARLVRGIHTENATRATLQALSIQTRRKGRSEAVNLQLARLADALADQGRYEEAATAHPAKKRAKEYLAIQAAIDRPDDDVCNCPPTEVRDPATGKTLLIPAQNKIEEVYSKKHEAIVPLVVCSKCPWMNAGGVLPDALRRRDAAMAAKERIADIAILK